MNRYAAMFPFLVGALLIAAASCAKAQLMPPTQADMAWSVADTTPATVVQPPAQTAVNLTWECYDYDYGYFTGLDVSTNLVDWTTIAGFPAQATNRVSLPRANMMFFKRWICETNRF